ncbi:hemin ABC transporter ATP-binding protein, partial [Staphylococcus pseudintermedius]|nr:hemin ABC transporter ATP-binding protein [Staphylococcus pseudintermedius]HDT9052779.1 hemin ABC transporter ATP-binding protein [Staphylococcus pseudintermedius]HDV6073050.1 hemin ABC transporter ATP-binding protein [Staphylococcus pseudintermedius]
THDQRLFDYADRIIYLNDGELMETATAMTV